MGKKILTDKVEMEVYNQGIDEAGRGCLVGPMFISLVVVQNRAVFDQLHLDDSKKFGSSLNGMKKRKVLYEEILTCCDVYISEISSSRIDREVICGAGLNVLERTGASALLSMVNTACNDKSLCMADGKNIFSPLSLTFSHVRSENKADSLYPATMAASICAKHRRDLWVKKYYSSISKSIGYYPSGGGYVNQGTLQFINNYKELTGAYPVHMRKSWKLKKYSGEQLSFDF
ncbi:MAG: hypothetical protein JXR95_10790 [Deltaproteobacteria bacterium]|nr:hypothetical protein [Deltaproteobacteria bacterium]